MQLARKITLPLALFAFLALGFSAWLSVREAVELHHADIEQDQSVAGRLFLEAFDRERALGNAAAGAERLLAAANRDALHTQMKLAPLSELTLTPSQREALGRGEPVFVLDVWETAETWLATTLPDGTPGVLWVKETLDAERDTVARIVRSHVLNFSTLALLWAVVAIGLGAVVVGRPMRSLADKARRVGGGDYSGPLDIAQRDEIGELAGEMNRMCEALLLARDRLQEEIAARNTAQDALRHADRLTTVGLLAAGIAHELGTLTVAARRKPVNGRDAGAVEGGQVGIGGGVLLLHQQQAGGAQGRQPRRDGGFDGETGSIGRGGLLGRGGRVDAQKQGHGEQQCRAKLHDTVK